MLRYYLIACLSFFMCGTAVADSGLTHFSLQLIWKHQFQFAGYYVAKEKGFYKDAGIDLSIREYSQNLSPVSTVLSGDADFAIGRSSILVERVNGADIVALLAAFQTSPLMLLTTKESGIKRPEDLKNKRVMITPDAKKQAELLAMLYQAGLTESDFVRQNHSFNIQSLTNGETDAMASYLSNEPFQMEQLNREYNVIHPKDYGFGMYSDILFTSKKLLLTHPTLVNKFRQATIDGWLYAFSHIDETAELIFNKYNSQNRSLEALKFEGRKLAELAFDHEGNFGSMTTEQLKIMGKIYLLLNDIEADTEQNLKTFIYDDGLLGLLALTSQEASFIAANNGLRLCGNPDWPPYSRLNLNAYEGILPDYMKLIQQRTGLQFYDVPSKSWEETLAKFNRGQCDLITGVMPTLNNSNTMYFSPTYISMPAVIAVHNDYRGPMEMNSLMRQPIALVRHQPFQEIMHSRYPNSNIIPVDTVKQGLRMVQSGEATGFIDAADAISHSISANSLTEIKVQDLVHDNFDLSIAIHPALQPTLLPDILKKAVYSISPREKELIRNHWITVRFEQKIDYGPIWESLVIIILLISFLLYRYRLMQKHNIELSKLARLDQLTELYNRRELQNILTTTLAIVNRYKRPLTFIFFDLDDFKKVNDCFGHHSGDSVLRQVAGIIRSNCRESDYYGRWGGEEFLIILPETSLSDGLKSAEKLRQSIENHDFHLPDSYQLTGSFGVTEYLHHESVEEVLSRVDEKLYTAKSRNKNCISY